MPAPAPYLARKGVQAYGVRFAADGWLLVPLRDAAGTLWNVQRIAPARNRYGTDKLFMKGGSKSRSLWHMLGDAAGAALVLVAEGYATAASLHEATGLPVAVAIRRRQPGPRRQGDAADPAGCAAGAVWG